MTVNGRTTAPLHIPLEEFVPFSGVHYEMEVPCGSPCKRLPDGTWAATEVNLAFNVLFCCLDDEPAILIDERFIEQIPVTPGAS